MIAQQGDAKKVLEARDSAMFEHYMGKVSHPASGSPEAGTCDRSTDGGFLVQRNEESDTCLSTSGGRPLKQSAEKCVSTRNSHYSDPVSSFTSALTGSVDDRHRREILTQNKISSSLACKRSSSSVVDAVSHGVTVVDNGAVKSSYQFLVDFKVLKDDLTALYAYVKVSMLQWVMVVSSFCCHPITQHNYCRDDSNSTIYNIRGDRICITGCYYFIVNSYIFLWLIFFVMLGELFLSNKFLVLN